MLWTYTKLFVFDNFWKSTNSDLYLALLFVFIGGPWPLSFNFTFNLTLCRKYLRGLRDPWGETLVRQAHSVFYGSVWVCVFSSGAFRLTSPGGNEEDKINQHQTLSMTTTNDDCSLTCGHPQILFFSITFGNAQILFLRSLCGNLHILFFANFWKSTKSYLFINFWTFTKLICSLTFENNHNLFFR